MHSPPAVAIFRDASFAHRMATRDQCYWINQHCSTNATRPVWVLYYILGGTSYFDLGKPSPKKSHVSMDTFRPPLTPPPPHLRTLRGVFFLTRTSDSRQLEKKARRLPFLVNLYFLREQYNFLCKNNHVVVVISDFWCYFYPKIASVKLVKTPPKAMEWG